MKSSVAVGTVVGILAIGLVGCSGAAPKPSLTPTPPFASADAAYKAAEATYRGYVNAFNDVDLTDPKTFEPVYGWLLDAALDTDRKELTTMAANHLKITGRTSVKSVVPLKGGNARWGDVSTEACYDVHEVDVTDSSGKSLVARDRLDIERITVTFSRDGGSPTGMRIIKMTLEATAGRCAL